MSKMMRISDMAVSKKAKIQRSCIISRTIQCRKAINIIYSLALVPDN